MRFKASVLASLTSVVCAQGTINDEDHAHLRFNPLHSEAIQNEKASPSDEKPTERKLTRPSRAVEFPYGSPCLNLPRDHDPHDQYANDGWKLVDFCRAGATGNRPAQRPDCHHNDDDSSVHTLKFPFKFYGRDLNRVFINNNGNLSFDRLYSTYTSTGFPVEGFPMIAPFWADVDTGDKGDTTYLGHVWMKELSNNKLAVTWEEVGYYSKNDSRLNSFQVLISDGSDPAMGLGNNVCFCYADMEWTTGDASEGEEGLEGIPATVGTNKGNGKTSFQLGRFDAEGNYDGPPDVNYLDGKGFCFDAAGQKNIPPIAFNFPSDNKINLENCAELDTELSFLSPEEDQTTIIKVFGVPDAMRVTKHNGYSATVRLTMTPTVNAEYQLYFKAKDNKGGVTKRNLLVTVSGCRTAKSPKMRCKERNKRAISSSACYAWTSIDNGSTSFSGGPVSLSQDPPAPFSIGVTSVTLTATDSEGRTNTCTRSVTVRQPRQGSCPVNKPPVMRCRSRDRKARSSPLCNVWTTIDLGSFDPNGDDLTRVLDPPPPYGIGNRTVTLTVTDSNGASSSCTKYVNVRPPGDGTCKNGPKD